MRIRNDRRLVRWAAVAAKYANNPQRTERAKQRKKHIAEGSEWRRVAGALRLAEAPVLVVSDRSAFRRIFYSNGPALVEVRPLSSIERWQIGRAHV